MLNKLIEYKGGILLFLVLVFLANSICVSFQMTQESNTNQVTYYEK